MPEPLLSVVLISYNQEMFIDDAVQSVVSSKMTDFELICVDDGSADETLAILNKWAATDPRISVMASEHTGRPGRVRNLGLDHATGRFVCFLDGDDFFVNDRIGRLAECIGAAPGTDMFFSDYSDYVDGADLGTAAPRLESSMSTSLRASSAFNLELDDGLVLHHHTVPEFCRVLLAESFVLNTGTVCIRRSLFADPPLRFSERSAIGEDNPVWLACALRARDIVYVPEVHMCWRKRAGSLTGVRTDATQRELVKSMQYMLRLAQHVLSRDDRRRAWKKVIEERRDVGVLQEQQGHWLKAVTTHAIGAVEFRSMRLATTAARTLLRAVLAALQVLKR
jgi:glycosyltransferase involved in cell wall biosynthesis